MPRTDTTTEQFKEANGKPRSDGPSVNRVILVGRCSADAELRYTAKGTAYTRLNIATSYRGEVQFTDVVAWHQAAEFAGKYLAKGRLVYCEGWLKTHKWQAEDGTTRRSVEVVADTLRALTPPRPKDQPEGAVEEGA